MSVILLTGMLGSGAIAAAKDPSGPAPLSPGLAAGTKQAQAQRSTWLTALGTGVVIGALVLIITNGKTSTTTTAPATP